MIALICAATFLLISTLVPTVTFFLNKEKLHMKKRIQVVVKPSHERIYLLEEQSKKKRNFKPFKRLWENLHSKVEVRISEARKERLKTLILEAGSPFGAKPADIILAQACIGGFSFLLFFLLFIPTASRPVEAFILAVLGGAFGIAYPPFYLNAKKKERIRKLEEGMPAFFDMINISIEAGMGLDGALKRATEQQKGVLSDEFKLSLEDIKLGKSRKRAFNEMIKRVPSKLLKSVMHSIIQSEQLGTGVSKALHAQTKRMREQQRQNMRERAAKAPIKMMLPLVFFIFPLLFIVLLGPVIINLLQIWK